MNTTIKRIGKCLAGKVFLHILRSNSDSRLSGTYGQLNLVRYYSGKEFVRLKQFNDKVNCNILKSKQHIKIGFVLYTSSIWNVDELYHILRSDPLFETDLILVHLKLSDEQSSNDTFNQTYEYFVNKQYSIKKAEEIDVSSYDILFYLTIGYILEKNVRINNVSLNTLVLYTSYSYMLADIPEKLTAALYHVSYRYYTDSDYYKQLLKEKSFYTGNAKYLGFPKMDLYFNAQCARCSEKKTIIYAPHHSVHRSTKNKAATFEYNHRQILDLAKKYEASTYWIYKPHPSLRSNSVAAGIFSSLEEYDSYEAEWNSIANGKVVSVGDYFPAFKESDAMITDSVSFLAEYQFTKKPLLLLESGKYSYNTFGKSILGILYRCNGNDIEEIEAFINNIISDYDPMKETRETFFKKYLEYRYDGTSASRRIYEDIKEIVGSKQC